MIGLPDALGGLRDRPVWVAWKDEGGRKVPKSPRGGNARSNDPSTWGTFDEAADAAAKRGYSGVGVMLGDGLGGVDLDGAVVDGEVAPWAQEIVDEFGSYAELSPSGTGLHVLFWADPSKTGAIGRADHARGIEMYNYGRYFTVTGKQLGDGAVRDATDVASAFAARTFSGEPPDAAVAKAVARLAADQVKRHANKTMADNCLRDKVRYARVPQGGETCGFCYMLASRGFVYHTRETAGESDHYHLSCDCKAMPGFDGMEVEGYDPDSMYDVYLEARAKCGDNPDPKDIARAIEKVLSKGSFRSLADPARDYFGSAEESNPAELKELIERLLSEGVELRERDSESMAYSPSLRPGGPGQLIYSKGMSWSAWLHETDHYERDKKNGFPGLSYYIAHAAEWDDMEASAYGVEIDLAVSLGYNDLAETLRGLLAKDMDRRGRNE